jgi:hypothetical protein
MPPSLLPKSPDCSAGASLICSSDCGANSAIVGGGGCVAVVAMTATTMTRTAASAV